jgi:hypothetical protein
MKLFSRRPTQTQAAVVDVNSDGSYKDVRKTIQTLDRLRSLILDAYNQSLALESLAQSIDKKAPIWNESSLLDVINSITGLLYTTDKAEVNAAIKELDAHIARLRK